MFFYRARYYNPGIGRAVSEDSYRFRGGKNFYAYVLNNPVKLKDPSGHFAIQDNIQINPIPARAIPTACEPEYAKACTNIHYVFVVCDCDEDTCPPVLPIYPDVTLVFGGDMFIPRENQAKAKRHEYGCHIDPAIAAVTPILTKLENTPFWSSESCKAECEATSQGVKNLFIQTLSKTQENEAACPFKVY
jgi:hypothetical protein